MEAQNVLFMVVFFGVVGMMAYLVVRGSGWRALAAKYPERAAYTGELRRCSTIQMTALGSEQTFPVRLAGGIVSVGVTSDALYIVAPSVVRFLFPTIQLPWNAIASAKPFDASGWVAPIAPVGESATVIQVEYDPGFSGDFVELETTAPKTCIRLPTYAIGDARSHLPLS